MSRPTPHSKYTSIARIVSNFKRFFFEALDYLVEHLIGAQYTIEIPSADSAPGASSLLARLCPDTLHVRLAPMYFSADLNWRRLGVVPLRASSAGPNVGLTPSELRAAKGAAVHSAAIGVCGKHGWPFPSEAYNPLLRAAEDVVARVMSEMPCVAQHATSDEGTRTTAECVAYQFAVRDTARPGNGAFSTVHADNVYCDDALRDFTPELHRAMNSGLGGVAQLEHKLQEGGGSCSHRDVTLLQVARGTKRMVRSFNLWILIEDAGRDAPLCFAELGARWQDDGQKWEATDGPCAHETAMANVASARAYDVSSTCGTRTLKREVLSRVTYRACSGSMQPGDAYIFETWGPTAAYHAGVERAHRRRFGPRARRLSVEVRVALVL